MSMLNLKNSVYNTSSILKHDFSFVQQWLYNIGMFLTIDNILAIVLII